MSTTLPPQLVKKSRKRNMLLVLLVLIVAGGAGIFLARGSGTMTWAVRKVYPSYRVRKWPGKMATCKPADFAKNVPVTTDVSVSFRVSYGALDPKSLNSKSVNLIRTFDQKVIPSTMDLSEPLTIHVKPNQPLDPRTNYQLHINPHLTDTRAVQMTPYIISFDTAGPIDSAIVFEKVVQPTAQGAMFTVVVIGPDGKLWAGSDDGRIFRFPVAADGMLGTPEVITSLKEYNKGKIPEYPNGDRLLIGLCFDPASTKENPIAWVTNGYPGFRKVPDLSGHVTRLAGPNLETVNDVVVGLPRSVKDHLTLQDTFGPDGALYFCNGSNSAMGAPDEIWGNRKQQPLCASVLRLDPSKVKLGEIIDAAPPKYDPKAPDAPLTVYATGIRNAYDLIWHSNGHLYVPTNGSAAEGNTPESPQAPSLHQVRVAEDDWLFDIQKGHYYGHPTVLNGHYVLNGGNPTPEYDFAEICEYPVGTKSDPAWTPATYSFGQHISANGVIEYKSDKFNGRMKGALIVCRYAYDSDLIVLNLDKTGKVSETLTGMKGMTRFNAPLDVIEDPQNGNLYVAEYGGKCITLLRAK